MPPTRPGSASDQLTLLCRLSCADPDGASLQLYSPLFRWRAKEEEPYHASIFRRMTEILLRTQHNPHTAYLGQIWCCAHAGAYIVAEAEDAGVDRVGPPTMRCESMMDACPPLFPRTDSRSLQVYAADKAPEMANPADLPCSDTAYIFERDLLDIFNPSVAAVTVAGRLIGKGLKPNASVRYVKSQIIRHLQTAKEPDFVSFVIRAGILGMYPGEDEQCVRAKADVYINIVKDGPAAVVSAIDPLSSREIFGLLCEFLYHCGNKHPVLKRLSAVPQAQDAAHFCNNLVRPKIHDMQIVRTRKRVAPPPALTVLPTLPSLWADAELNRKVSTTTIQALGKHPLPFQMASADAHPLGTGGFDIVAPLYGRLMREAVQLPRGMRFAREPMPTATEEAAMVKLEMHASREAHSLSIVPLCAQARMEACRFNPDPVWIAICSNCRAVRARRRGHRWRLRCPLTNPE